MMVRYYLRIIMTFCADFGAKKGSCFVVQSILLPFYSPENAETLMLIDFQAILNQRSI
jgi:hypothetical protein